MLSDLKIKEYKENKQFKTFEIIESQQKIKIENK